MEKHEEEEAKRDQTWEEFLAMYQQHIEKKVDPSTRTANRPDDNAGPDDYAKGIEEEEEE